MLDLEKKIDHIDAENIPDNVKERARQGKERIRNSQKGEIYD